jgi:hypothetical protein
MKINKANLYGELVNMLFDCILLAVHPVKLGECVFVYVRDRVCV